VDRVDLQAGVVRLDPGTTKNKDGRSFYVTAELREVLRGQLDSLLTQASRRSSGCASSMPSRGSDWSPPAKSPPSTWTPMSPQHAY
jgi:hypothetical protein